MLKLAGRRVYFAALAVPIAMVIAPLTASAGVPDEAVVTEHAPTAIVTDEDAVDAESVAITDEDSAEFVFSPGPDWYYGSDETSVGNDDDVNVTYVINGIHDDGVIGNHEHDETVVVEEDEDVSLDVDHVTYEDEEAVEDEDGADEDEDKLTGVSPAHDVDVIEDDDEHEWADEDDTYGVSYSDVAAAAGPEGAWVSSTESGAVFEGDDFGHALDEEDVAGAYYEEVTAGAGDEGAFVDSIESASGAFGEFDDNATGAYYEEVAAFAGQDGAWADSTESAAGELD